MSNKISEDELWQLIGYVKSSSPRYTILKILENDILIPTDISKQSDLTPIQVSRALRDLKKHGLVKCMNEQSHKGRIYLNTETGSRILEILNNKSIK